MQTKRLSRVALHALLVIVWIGSAQAKNCTVTSAAVAFGAYNPASSSSLDTTGSLIVNCSGNTSVVLSLSVGNGAGASYSAGRKMTLTSGGTLTYNLYADSARTQVLGDGTGGSVMLILSIGKNALTQAIWGRIPGNQRTVSAGSYTDTVVVTISY